MDPQAVPHCRRYEHPAARRPRILIKVIVQYVPIGWSDARLITVPGQSRDAADLASSMS
jgi:hypothetical protein